MDTTYDSFKRRCISTELTFAWFPQKCFITDKFIWWKFGYMQTAMWAGPGTPLFEERWYDADAFLIAKLKGEV